MSKTLSAISPPFRSKKLISFGNCLLFFSSIKNKDDVRFSICERIKTLIRRIQRKQRDSDNYHRTFVRIAIDGRRQTKQKIIESFRHREMKNVLSTENANFAQYFVGANEIAAFLVPILFDRRAKAFLCRDGKPQNIVFNFNSTENVMKSDTKRYSLCSEGIIV